jgi:hypothetical protein
MNARTSRLLRRVAFAVHMVEAQVAKPGQRVPTEAMQLASLKLAWNATLEPERGAMRHRLVGIFNTIVQGPQ